MQRFLLRLMSNLIKLLIVVSLIVAVSDVSNADGKTGKKLYSSEQCGSEIPEYKCHDYEWRLVAVPDESSNSIYINVTLKLEKHPPQKMRLKAPFDIKLPDNFDYVILANDHSAGICDKSLQQINVIKIAGLDDTIEYELSTKQPKVEFRHEERSTIKIVPSPDESDYYVGTLYNYVLKRHKSGFNTYTYPYEYCPDSLQELHFPDVEDEGNQETFEAFVKTFYCYFTRGDYEHWLQQRIPRTMWKKSYHEYKIKLAERIKFPYKHRVNSIDETTVKEITKKDFVNETICCGNVRPTLKIDGSIGYFHRDKHACGAGEHMYFELDSKDKKWYLIKIEEDDY